VVLTTHLAHQKPDYKDNQEDTDNGRPSACFENVADGLAAAKREGEEDEGESEEKTKVFHDRSAEK